VSVIQISVVLENVPGMLLDVSERLGAEGINIRAISVADTSDASTVRFVSDDPQKTANVLRSRSQTPQGCRDKRPLSVPLPRSRRERAAHNHHGRGQDRGGAVPPEEELGAHLRERNLHSLRHGGWRPALTPQRPGRVTPTGRISVRWPVLHRP